MVRSIRLRGLSRAPSWPRQSRNPFTPRRSPSARFADRGSELRVIAMGFIRVGGRKLTVLCSLASLWVLAYGSPACAQGRPQLSKAPQPVAVTANTPSLQSIHPPSGRAGDVIQLDGIFLGSSPEDHRVVFRSTLNPDVFIDGQVIAVQRLGLDPQGNPRRRLEVVVPTGVRDSEVELIVARMTGPVSAGMLAFGASPTLWGAVHGNNNIGFVFLDPIGGFLPTTVVLYGQNLSSLTEVTFLDELSRLIPSSSWTVGAPPTANFVVPEGIEAITATLPTSGFGFFDCFEAARMAVRVTSSAGVSNTIELRVRKVNIGTPGNVPATITGLLVPAGVRSGDIEIQYNLVSEPPSETWTVVPEYRDPTTGTFLPCTPRGGSGSGTGIVAGAASIAGSNPVLIGPGQSHRFIWDSRADLPGQAGATVLRLRPVATSTNSMFVCSPNEFRSEWIAFDNLEDAPSTIREDFTTDEFLDVAQTDADWNTTAGQLQGTGVDSPLLFGVGVEDVRFFAGRDYEFRTDSGEVYDVTVPSAPLMLALDNPGAAQQEFHFRSWIVDAGARAFAVGAAPLRIRLSGSGDASFIAASFQGELDLSGRDASPATAGSPSLGAAGGVGAGSGGDGAVVVVQAVPQRVADVQPATAGGGAGGGGPGDSMTYLSAAGVSNPRPGPGGGGGHATRGEGGVISPTTGNPRSSTGRGGRAAGDAPVTELTAGSGGGGGGACAFRVNGSNPPQDRLGGGGGGGGGAFELVVAGSIRIDGDIDCDGGRGAVGATSTGGGGGGGGSGGAIALRALGSLIVDRSSRVTARGGMGGGTPGGLFDTYRGGHGAPGRVRLEAVQGVFAVDAQDFSGVPPEAANVRIREATQPGDTGLGIDGDLDLTQQAGVFVVDTDFGTITAPSGAVVLTAASGGGVFELGDLRIPEAVTLRGVGASGLVLRVAREAVVEGTVDVSGFDGAPPQFAGPGSPTPGNGGAAGPGGGRGGTGGLANGPFFVHGEDGHLPAVLPPGTNELPSAPSTSSPIPTGMPIFGATGGRSVASCPELTCVAGSGGGGGHSASGLSGSGGEFAGDGGGAFGNFVFIDNSGAPLRAGGGGGAGGGGSAQGIAVPFLASAAGSGGGGGGGYVEIVVGGPCHFRPAARVLARGGDAFTSGVLAGHGGAGAGGAIVLRANGGLRFEAAVFSVAGGLANRPSDPPLPGGENLGVAGGDGAPGRILIEALLGVNTDNFPVVIFDPSPTIGQFAQAFSTTSRAITLPYAIGRNGVRFAEPRSTLLSATPPANAGDLPFYRVLFSAGRERTNLPGAAIFGEWTDDLDTLADQDFVRLRFLMFGSPSGAAQPAVDEIELMFQP